MTRTSNHYVTTISKDDPNYESKVSDIRNHVAVTNRILRADHRWNRQIASWHGKDAPDLVQYRVCLRGRGPKVKSEYRNFWTGKIINTGYDFAGNVIGGFDNASRVDVYIYRR